MSAHDGSGRMSRKWMTSAAAGVLLAAMTGLAVWGMVGAGVFASLRFQALDHLTRCDELDDKSPLVTTVEVDETSLRALSGIYGRFQQWPRELYGLLYSVLDKAGAEAVVFDILFDSPDPVDPGSDSLFAKAVAQGRAPAVFAALFYESETSTGDVPEDILRNLCPPVEISPEVEREVPDFNSAAFPFPELLSAASAVGVVVLEQDADGVTRGIRPFYSYRGRMFPALSLAALIQAGMADEPRLEDGRLLCEGIPPAPVQADGLLRMRFTGGAERYRRLSFAGVLKDALAVEKGEDVPDDLVSAVKGRIVLVGASAAGLYDLKVTPVDEGLPGLFIHAAAVESLVEGRWIRNVPGGGEFIVVLVAALVMGLAGRLLPRWWALPCVLPGFLWPYVLSRWLFSGGMFLDFTPPLAAAAGGMLAASVHRYLGEERRAARLRSAFGKYLDEAVIRELERFDFEDISPEVGRRRRMTVLFSDVRGFTSMSEKMSPEEVVEILNEYLDVMTRIIRNRHGGTHDKFVGDAIMAFWGAPKPMEDHAERAVEAALDMLAELQRMRNARREEGRPVFGIGVGINTGEMVVGNVGSSDKLNYTVIGDEVNLAARLEALTREFDADIIVSEATAEAVAGKFVLEPLGETTVKGKAKPVRIFAVRGRAVSAPPASTPRGSSEGGPT